ncbi:ABC transporter ATP-binding protein [Candidatus Aerophobetes bacterium]|nr:ABC transporter ATP-binding protein [Candidatus Aerophobetes bacterium]
MLKVRELEKSFGGIKAIDKCSLRVQIGSITGLIGPNGAGKTTLFNLISGVYKPDRGQIWFMDDRIDGLPSHQIARKSIARTFQIPREFKEMTVLENLMLIPKHQLGENVFNTLFRPVDVREQEKQIMEKATSILEFVELAHLKDEYAKSLSSGQKKLLELAKMLMSDPRVILLDEPGAGVNPTLMRKLVENIEELRQQGITFFLIEHDMDLVTYLCDKVIVMNKGRTMAEGTPHEIKKDKNVLEAYLGS